MLSVASRGLYLIRRLKTFLRPPDLVRIYHAIITSVFLYASPVYGRLPSKLLSKLEMLQKRAHKIICGVSCKCELFPSLCSKLKSSAVRLLRLSCTNSAHPLHEFAPCRLPASGRLRLPSCNTERRLSTSFPWSSCLYNSSLCS